MILTAISVSVYCLIFTAGAIGNSLYLAAVKRNEKLHTAVFILLANEALSDLLCTLLSIFIVLYDNFGWIFGDSFCRVFWALIETTFAVSCLSLSAVAVERYKSICFAIQYTRRTNKWSLKACFIIWIVSFLLGSPLVYFNQMYRVDSLNDATMEEFFLHHPDATKDTTLCDAGANMDTDGKTIQLIFQFIFTYFIPLTVLIYTHSKIILTLKENSKTKFQLVSESTSQSKKIAFKEHIRNIKISKLLAVTTIITFTLLTPVTVYRIIRKFNAKTPFFGTLFIISNILALASTATNFFITLCISKEFRDTVKDLLKIECKRTSNTTLSPLSNQPGIATINVDQSTC